jgi:hypothetical protein
MEPRAPLRRGVFIFTRPPGPVSLTFVTTIVAPPKEGLWELLYNKYPKSGGRASTRSRYTRAQSPIPTTGALLTPILPNNNLPSGSCRQGQRIHLQPIGESTVSAWNGA